VDAHPWNYPGKTSSVLRTEHYAIHTTITDREFLAAVSQLMEGAYSQYRLLTPNVVPSPQPMDCYLFAQRPEWAQFTASRCGQDAAVYLQINRGGYTVRDWFVAYYIGDTGTFAVAAHEGWHQYVARHFKSRLPPFLEEGISTMFENIRWSGDLPRWDLGVNPNRALKLRRAIEDHDLFPLEKLITMHAGNVVGMSGPRIEAFYAQNWAFALFLMHADGDRYRSSFQKLLCDTANGTAYLPGEVPHSVLPDAWDPHSVRPLLERYLGAGLPQIEKEYQAYMRKIAFNVDFPADPA
jgi:hypothetical protein